MKKQKKAKTTPILIGILTNQEKFNILLIFFLSICLNSYAQKEDWQQLVRDNIAIKNSIDSLVVERNFLADSLTIYDQYIQKHDSDLQYINDTIRRIEKTISKKNIESLENRKNSLLQQKASLIEKKNTINSNNLKRQHQIDSINKEIDNLHVYAVILKKQKCEEIMQKGFSTITREEVESVNASLMDLGQMENSLTYKEKVDRFNEYYALFLQATEAITLNTPQETIDHLRDLIYPLIDRTTTKLNEKQWSELDNLDIKLSRYENGKQKLKNIVNQVNTDTTVLQYRTCQQKEECIEAIRQILTPVQRTKDDVFSRYFDMIPFLQNLLNTYWEELQSDPFNTTKTEEIINTL